MEVAPFFVDFHHFLSIFTIFYWFSRFTHFCRDLHFVAIYSLFPQFFFGQNSLLRNITRFLHVWLIDNLTCGLWAHHVRTKSKQSRDCILDTEELTGFLQKQRQFWQKGSTMLTQHSLHLIFFTYCQSPTVKNVKPHETDMAGSLPWNEVQACI